MSFFFHKRSLQTEFFLVWYQPHTLRHISLSELPFAAQREPREIREASGVSRAAAVNDVPCPRALPPWTSAAGPPLSGSGSDPVLQPLDRLAVARKPVSPGRASPARRGAACRRVASCAVVAPRPGRKQLRLTREPPAASACVLQPRHVANGALTATQNFYTVSTSLSQKPERTNRLITNAFHQL